MVEIVETRLREQPVKAELEAIARLLNKEHSPVISEARRRLNELIQSFNPGDVVAAAAAGIATLPATPEAFLEVTIDGAEYSIPLYPRSP